MSTLNDCRVIYQAIFINPEDVSKLIKKQDEKLPNIVKDIHCTFKFKPTEAEIKKFSKLLGQNLTLKVVGYCSNGQNSGFEIELAPEQENAYTNNHKENNESISTKRTTPHITISMTDGAKAADTGTLPFSRKNFEPFFVHGKAGFFVSKIKNNEKISEIIFEPILTETKDMA